MSSTFDQPMPDGVLGINSLRKALLWLGNRFQQTVYQKADPAVAFKAAFRAAFQYPELFRYLGGNSTIIANCLMHAIQWAQCGFPCLEPTQKLAAVLMASSVPSQIIDHTRLPWKSVAVDVPAGLVSTQHGFVVLGTAIDKTYGIVAQFGDSILYRQEPSLSEVAAFTETLSSDPVTRQHDMLVRLLVGGCLELDRLRPSSTSGGGPCKRTSPKPRAWAIKLTRPVQVDARQAVLDYVTGNGQSPFIQTLVRGHWRSHTDKHNNRKLIHIEPYWRGPDGNPIGMRKHKVGL